MKSKQKMHNNQFNNQNNRPLLEGLQYKDLEGMMKPTVHVDEFSSKMGDDDDIIVLSFFLRGKASADDLVNWFEKGYDFVLDADTSPGEIKPNRFLVYVEIRRRSSAPKNVAELIDDLGTLTEFEPDDWQKKYKGKTSDWSPEAFAEKVPLSPKEYRERTERDLNEMRVAAGLNVKTTYDRDLAIQSIQSAAGIL
jgi:hypothetical protein